MSFHAELDEDMNRISSGTSPSSSCLAHMFWPKCTSVVIACEENVIILTEQVLYWVGRGWRLQSVLPDTLHSLYYEQIVWEVWKS